MMEKIFISVEKSSRMISLTKKYIGNDLENLQQELVFKFTDEFVDGSARLEYQTGNNKYHIPMTKDGETYTIPIKNVITKEGKISMQLVIVQTAQDEEIPVFKSNVFDMYCNKSINAQEEAPDDYEYWLDVIQTKLADIDDALEQVDNLDINATKIGKVATVSITNKDGITKSVEITDGTDGEKGETGPANTLVIGTVVKGDEANASITGDAPNQTLNLVLPKGDKGEKGATGQTGATGPANTLTIGTVSKGDTASATITGTSPNQVLNLVLPKGDKGDTGEAGPQGNPGANGTNGTNGQDGFSPIATVTQTQSGATISITDKNGTTTANVSNGQDGEEYDDTEVRGLIAEKQNTLVSGSNIKTINNTSLLGNGNIDIQGGSDIVTINYNDTDAEIIQKLESIFDENGNIVKNAVFYKDDYLFCLVQGGTQSGSTIGVFSNAYPELNQSLRLDGTKYECVVLFVENNELTIKRSITQLADTNYIGSREDLTINEEYEATHPGVYDRYDFRYAIDLNYSLAKGTQKAISFSDYQTMITTFNGLGDAVYNVGQSIYIVTLNVPDLWISSIESSSSMYTYVDDATFINALQNNGYVQVGYYRLSMLETLKVDLTNYQTKIDSTHKLSSDLVDDTNKTNKFVTSAEKTTWNNKQNAISDLSSIRSGASAGATAVQPGDLATVATSGSYNDLTNKPTIPTVTTLTQAQYDALTTKDADTYYCIVEE